MQNTFKEGIRYFTSDLESDELKPFTNQEVIKKIDECCKNFEIAFIPEKYDIAFILIEEDKLDSFNDKWKTIFLKKIMKIPELSNGTLTLDNLDALQSYDSCYEIYKEINGSFEDTLKISFDLINKHRFGYTKELSLES